MVNQWGRNGNFASGSAGSSRGAGGVIIPAFVALIIGAGGGYGGARYFSGVSASDLAARDKKIAELNQTLSEMKFDSQGEDGQQRQRIKELESQVEQLQHTKESLKQYADQQASQADSDAQAEIAALKKTIEEAGDVSGELNRTRKSLKVSELQIIELEKTVNDQKAEIGKLQAAIQQRTDQANPAIVLLQAQKQALESQLADAKKAASDVPALKSRLSALEDEIARRDDAGAASKLQMDALLKQKNELQAKLDAALKSAGDAGQQARKIADLQKQLDALAESLAERDQAARDANSALKRAKADLDKSEKQLATLKEQNGTLRTAQDDLRKQVVALNDTIASLKAAPSGEDKPTSDDSQTRTDGGLTPRNRGDVEKAVEDLPGYDNLSPDKQEMLISMLERGECVTDSLKAAYGHVSPISLSRLFRDLGGGC